DACLNDDVVAANVVPIDLRPGAGQPFPLGAQQSGHFIVTLPDTRLNGVAGVDVLGFEVREAQQLFDVLPVPGVNEAMEHLHVLLRHCPRSISRRHLEAHAGGGAGVSPCRFMTSPILAASGGPPALAARASRISRK